MNKLVWRLRGGCDRPASTRCEEWPRRAMKSPLISLTLSKNALAVRLFSGPVRAFCRAQGRSTEENAMRTAILTSLAALTFLTALPVYAADTMMLDKGRSIMIEPDGSMTMLPAM